MNYRVGLPLFLAMLVLAVFLAPRWLRQKIIWQRAALPYLFRLADARHTLHPNVAQCLQALIDGGPPTPGTARQVVIFGPIGSGRTALATGIGTEFAFKGRGVRYTSFDWLLEVAQELRRQAGPRHYSYDPGPVNIYYWPWWQSQVLILDDISPVVSTDPRFTQMLDLRRLLDDDLGPIRAELANRHTVWVFGGDRSQGVPASDAILDQLAEDIRDFCSGSKPPLLVKLVPPTDSKAPRSALSAAEPPPGRRPS